MSADQRRPFIRNIAEVPWQEFPDHFGGALSKPLVIPDTAASRHSTANSGLVDLVFIVVTSPAANP